MEERPKPPVKWYLTPAAVLAWMLIAGPFAIPLIWISPVFKTWQKAVITILLVAFTVWFIGISADIYQKLLVQKQALRDSMR